MCEKTRQFLILSDNTACPRISTCPAHVLKTNPANFSGWAFLANFGGKSAVKLRKIKTFNLSLQCTKNYPKYMQKMIFKKCNKPMRRKIIRELSILYTWLYVLLFRPVCVSSYAKLELKIFKIYIDKQFVL